MPSVPTSPLIMPCPTPIHSPAPVNNQRQMSAAKEATRFTFESPQVESPTAKSKLESSPSTKVSTTLRVGGSGVRTIITPPTPAPFDVTDASSPPMLSKHLTPRITRQTIKDLPPIPKFKKISSFPIVRRITLNKSNVVMPKLMSLELFNPETDDLDSDSSEPSSPDSIDSVINALQPASSNSPTEPLLDDEAEQSLTQPIGHKTISNSPVAPLVEAAAAVANKLENAVELASSVFDDIDLSSTERIIINQNDINLNSSLQHQQHHLTNNISDEASDSLDSCREQLCDFAEKLSAQLLKELDETTEDIEASLTSVEGILSDQRDEFLAEDPYVRKISGDIKNLNILRDELRERRLQLANLSTKQHSSQELDTPPMTIQELEEDDSPPLSAKIQSHLSQNPNLITNLGTPQATKKQQKINDFIPEENEENDEDESSKADEDSSLRSRISFSHLSYNATNNNFSSTHDTALLLAQEDSFDEVDNSSSVGLQQMKQNLLKNIKHPNKLSDSNNNSNTNSCESWANSNSTTASLDSPSVGGGSATHHRYYHVFREGELDALINKHVGNLHIVSSYYERASW